MLLIFTNFDEGHGFATQEEYLNRDDVSRGHARTIYNRSLDLIGNFNFAYILIDTMLFQSVVKLRVIAMCHQTNSGKSATGPNTLLAISSLHASA